MRAARPCRARSSITRRRHGGILVVSSTRYILLATWALVLWNAAPDAVHAADAADASSASDLARAEAAWPRENAISNIVIKPGADDDWLLDFDYAFVGKPPALLRIEL